MPDTSPRPDGAPAFSALVLLATARAAAHTARAMAERRSGLDPSEQEPEGTARAGLERAASHVAGLTVRLRLRDALGAPLGEGAALAQGFEDRVLLADLARALHRAHQQLLSLYPAVSDTIVEDTRRLHGHVDHLVGDDAPEDAFGPLAEALADWITSLRLSLLAL